MGWIYLSPHLDDVALSCGGLIWEQKALGDQVEIWTLCAGDPPEGELTTFARSLHERWGTGADATAVRRREDEASCAILGVPFRHLDVPDCIYRRLPGSGVPVIEIESDLTSPLSEDEYPLADALARRLAGLLPKDARLVSPLCIGGHVDHHLARRVAEGAGRPLWFYADFPYIARQFVHMNQWVGTDWGAYSLPILPAGLAAWQQCVAEHASQIGTFWKNDQDMRAAITVYWQERGGATLWSPPANS